MIWRWLSRRKPESLVLEISVVIEPEEGGGFYAHCPGLEGLHVGGETIEETLRNAEDAILLYLKSIATHGDALPVGPDFRVSRRQTPEVPQGAFLQHLRVRWPSLQMHGNS